MKPIDHKLSTEPASSRSPFGPSTSQFLPITQKEVEARGWDEVDVVLVSGDAYIDHPSFGTAVIGRLLEAEGYRVAICPQPNWQDDLRDFKKFGKPRLFFGVTAGCMDSMVNHYTARRRRRSDDAYTPGNQAGFRPDYPCIVYTKILKSLYPDTPVVLGGIEASLRRFTHYDYWKDQLEPSILVSSGADLLLYGMGEKPVLDVARSLAEGNRRFSDFRQAGSLVSLDEDRAVPGRIELPSFEDCLANKKTYAAAFRHVEEESNKRDAAQLVQRYGKRLLVVNPPYPVLSSEELDRSFDLPYTRLPHPKYAKRGVIPAYEMIRHSVNLHRGCFGGCAFCTISAHQGKEVSSRSEASILKEVDAVCRMADFKGYISDLGGPSANMYGMRGRDETLCARCSRYSCLHPKTCPNLNTDHSRLLALYERVAADRRIKKVFVTSGIRYDLFDSQSSKPDFRYAEYVIRHGVSGRLKVAPEHTEDSVLNLMRKPSFDRFVDFKNYFEDLDRKLGLRQQLIPYFISSHPGCRQSDMEALSQKVRALGYRLEAVQDFTPTPMTLATEIYYSGYHPYTLEKVYCACTPEEKEQQNQVFFRWKEGPKTYTKPTQGPFRRKKS